MDTTFRGLVDAVVADPGDDTPRLILADYIEDRGDGGLDSVWAMVIRRQCADPDWQPWDEDGDLRDWHMAATRWVRRLYDAPSCGMIEPKPERYVGVGIDRGFVGALSVSQEQWLATGPAVVRMAPVRWSRIDDCHPHWPDLESTPPRRKHSLFRRLTRPVQYPHEVDNAIWPFLDRLALWTDHMAAYATVEGGQADMNRAALAWAHAPSPADLEAATAYVAGKMERDRKETAWAGLEMRRA